MPKSILSYADQRFSQGEIYKNNGFSEIYHSKPNYFWFKNNKVLSRYDAQAKNLINILGKDFDISKSEFENLTSAGYFKCEDTGNLVLEKVFI